MKLLTRVGKIAAGGVNANALKRSYKEFLISASWNNVRGCVLQPHTGRRPSQYWLGLVVHR